MHKDAGFCLWQELCAGNLEKICSICYIRSHPSHFAVLPLGPVLRFLPARVTSCNVLQTLWDGSVCLQGVMNPHQDSSLTSGVFLPNSFFPRPTFFHLGLSSVPKGQLSMVLWLYSPVHLPAQPSVLTQKDKSGIGMKNNAILLRGWEVEREILQDSTIWSFEICFHAVNWNEETDHVKNGQKIHKKHNRSVFNLCKSTF